MFDLDSIRHTAFYKDLKKKASLEIAQKLLDAGESIERTARILDLNIKEVRKLAEKQPQ